MSRLTDSDQEMPLVSHLTELRTRLLRIVGAVFLLFAGLFYFSQDIYALVAAPLRAYLPEGATMIATGVASPFLTPFKLTLMVALFLAIPIILHQIWGFIAPGLYKHEKRIAIPLLISSISAVLRRHGLRLLRGVPDHVRLLRQRDPGRRGDDDRHRPVPGLSSSPCSLPSAWRSKSRLPPSC